VPDDEMQALAVCKLVRKTRQRVGARCHEGRAQEQVFGRVAAERKFRRQHQARALLMGFAGRLCKQARIAGKITHRRIDLCDRRFHEIGP
jgi:hypothetical protein